MSGALGLSGLQQVDWNPISMLKTRLEDLYHVISALDPSSMLGHVVCHRGSEAAARSTCSSMMNAGLVQLTRWTWKTTWTVSSRVHCTLLSQLSASPCVSAAGGPPDCAAEPPTDMSMKLDWPDICGCWTFVSIWPVKMCLRTRDSYFTLPKRLCSKEKATVERGLCS